MGCGCGKKKLDPQAMAAKKEEQTELIEAYRTKNQGVIDVRIPVSTLSKCNTGNECPSGLVCYKGHCVSEVTVNRLTRM